jgi:hypothetical protein
VGQLPPEIQQEASVLFHDVRLCDIDPDAHASFVMERVLDRGSMRSVRALLRAYGEDGVRGFFCAGGAQRVSRRTARLWQNYFGLTDEECTPRSSPRIRSPFWPS